MAPKGIVPPAVKATAKGQSHVSFVPTDERVMLHWPSLGEFPSVIVR